MGFTLAITLLSLAAPASSPTVPTADAQGNWRFWMIVNVPWRDVDGDGRNDHDPVFRIRTNKVGSPHPWCPDFIPPNGTRVRHELTSDDPAESPTPDGTFTWYTGRNRHAMCVYETDFPNTLSSGISGITWTLVPESVDAETRTGDLETRTARATYIDGRTEYEPDLTFDMPYAVPSHVYGSTFEVEFVKTATSHGACRLHDSLDQEFWHVTDAGIIERQPDTAAAKLIHRPDGTAANCRYEIIWPHIEGFSAPDNTFITASTKAQTGTYLGSVRAPKIELDLTNAIPAAARAAPFEIHYRHAPGTPTACQALAEVHDDWRIDANGVAEQTSTALLGVVTDPPNTDCLYEVVWPDLAGLVKPTTNPVIAPVEGRNSATGVYTLDTASVAVNTRVHEMRIDFPFRDVDGDGVNDYSPQFRVHVRRRGGTGDRAAGDDCPESVYVTASIASGVGQQEIRNARLAGMHADCKLAFDFPTDVESGVPGIVFHLNRGGSRYGDGSQFPDFYDKFTDGTDLDAIASYGDGSYVRSIATSFRFNGTVPHDARNKTYRITFEPRATSIAAVCRGRPDENWEDWRIDADGNIARVGEPKLRLVGRAAAADGLEGAACVPYTVVWPDIYGFSTPTATSLTFDEHTTAKSFTGTYEAVPIDTYFHHNYDDATQTGDVVAIWLDRTAAIATPLDIYETFSVTIAPSPESPTGCDAYYNNPATSRTVQVRLNRRHTEVVRHVVSTRDGPDRIVLRPAGADMDCEYDVTFPQHEDGPSNFYRYGRSFDEGIRPGGGLNEGFAAAAYTLTQNPSSSPSMFDASVEIETTANVTADTTFVVQLVPGALPADCSETMDVPVTIPAGTSSASTSVDLIMRPNRDAQYCSYTVNWPDREASGSFHSELEAFDEGSTLGGAVRSVRNQYEFDATLAPHPTTFEGSLIVSTTENVTVDTSFAVSVLPPATPADCTGRLDRTITLLAATQSATLSLPGLVHQPAGSGAGCIYTVDWPDNETVGTAWHEDATFVDASTEVSDANPSAAVRYGPPPPPPMAMPFVPSVSVSVPPLEGLTAGANLFSGASIGVTVARDAAMTHADCSLASSLPVPFTVSAQGAASQTALPASLIGTLDDGSTMCGYTVTFPSVSSASGAQLSWTLTPDVTMASLSGSSPSVAAAYATGIVSFVPDAMIGAPTGHGGKQVTAMFASSGAGCDGATLTYELQADGTAEPLASNEALVAYPAGATAPSALCSYDVTFSPTEVNGKTLELQANSTTTVTGLNQTITAAYAPPPPPPPMTMTFVPSVSVSVPPGLVGLTAGESLFAGASIPVTVARDATTTHADCSLASSLSVPFTVDASGVASQTALPASLNGRLADGTTECGYEVTFPPVSSASSAQLIWALTPGTTSAPLDGSTTSASSDYRVGAVTFVPDATITVPVGHADEQLSATFAGSAVGCSGFGGTPVTLTYTVAAPNTVEADATNEALVAYPDGSTTLCSYDVTFAATEVNGTTLALQPNSSMTVTGLDQAITAEYLPASDDGTSPGDDMPGDDPPDDDMPDDEMPGDDPPGDEAPGDVPPPAALAPFDGSIEVRTTEAVAVATRFDVDVVPPVAPSGCSAMQTVEVTIAAAATSAAVSVPGLIRQPATGAAECVYTVSWRENEHGGTTMWVLDDTYVDAGTELSNASLSASNRYTPAEPADQPVDPGNTNQPVSPGDTNPTVTPTVPTGGNTNRPVNTGGGAPRPASTGGGGGRTSGGGGGGGGRTSGGGTSGGGGAATGPWQVVAASRVPVVVSVTTPAETMPAAAELEVMLSVPGTCGDDVTAFAGLPANIGIVYALTAQPDATVDVLAADALRLPSHAARGDQTRGCELRVTLLTAPEGCRLQSADGDASAEGPLVDDDGRSYVELTGDVETQSYNLNPSLTCG